MGCLNTRIAIGEVGSGASSGFERLGMALIADTRVDRSDCDGALEAWLVVGISLATNRWASPVRR